MIAAGTIGAMPRKLSGKSLSKEQNERVRAVLRKLVGKMSQTELEKTLGVDQTTISSFLKGRQGTSFMVAARIAQLAGESWARLLDLPGEVDGVPYDPTRPNRSAAILALVIMGNNKDDVMRWADAVSARHAPNFDPPSETWWLPQIQTEREAEHEQSSRGSPADHSALREIAKPIVEQMKALESRKRR